MKLIKKTNEIGYCRKTGKRQIISIYLLLGIPVFRTFKYCVFSNVFDDTFS